jgi:predicted nucleic acid-binding protein
VAVRFVLDTSAYSAFNRGDQRLRSWFRAEKEILVPLIVVGELEAGFACGSKRNANQRLLDRFLDAPNVELITLTTTTAKVFADIFLALRKAGNPIGTNDMWIAAMALETKSPLLTLDHDFCYVPELNLIEPATDD